MPNYHHQIDKHLLFPIERRGDTLIVAPKGDPASFANLNFNLEHAALLQLLKTGPYQNLLVDLSGSNYFGAKVLGAIAEWAKRIAERGGQVAVCGASGDMRELLHIYGFELQWPQFPTREAGIKAIVKESSLQSVKRQWKLGVFLLCLVAVVGAGYLIQPYYSDHVANQRDYQTILAVWEDMEALKAANAPPVEWRKLEARARGELEPIVDDLEDRAGTHSVEAQAAQCLLRVSKHYILDRLLVERNRLDLDVPSSPIHEIHWKTTAVYLEFARRHLNGEDTSDLALPQGDYNPEDSPEEILPGEEQPPEGTEPKPGGEQPPQSTGQKTPLEH